MFNRIEKGLWWDKTWTLVEGYTPVNDRLDIPLKTRKPTVFAIWNDLFHEDAPGDFIHNVFQTMYKCPQHIFLILTKRPERVLNILTSKAVIDNIKFYQKALSHVWIGVTAENQEQADKRIPLLLQLPAAKRFVSIEPMLGPVNLVDIPIKLNGVWTGPMGIVMSIRTGKYISNGHGKSLIDWVICGCETGPKRRPTNIEWIRDLRDQCQAGVPFFLKQMDVNGKIVKAPELDGRQWLEVPECQ
ncbi:MAG: DUF5131 family protein [Nitrospirae bacterium]|nr:MAG: DUF5131 family protein [Nitrospirota bacterium]